MGWLVPSEREPKRIEVLGQVIRDLMTEMSAANVLGLSRGEPQRLRKAMQTEGAAAIVRRARGRASNNRTDPGIRDFTLALSWKRFADVGSTLAAEKPA